MMLDVQAICRTKLVKLNETDKQNSQKLSPLRLKPLHPVLTTPLQTLNVKCEVEVKAVVNVERETFAAWFLGGLFHTHRKKRGGVLVCLQKSL